MLLISFVPLCATGAIREMLNSPMRVTGGQSRAGHEVELEVMKLLCAGDLGPNLGT
jgi:hypothetical protein